VFSPASDHLFGNEKMRPPSQSLNFNQQDDTQSSRSGDTPIPASHTTHTNSSHNAENNSESVSAIVLVLRGDTIVSL
ncbi:homeobox protein Meis1, partial [Biomphalaria pfeifferi]